MRASCQVLPETCRGLKLSTIWKRTAPIRNASAAQTDMRRSIAQADVLAHLLRLSDSLLAIAESIWSGSSLPGYLSGMTESSEVICGGSWPNFLFRTLAQARALDSFVKIRIRKWTIADSSRYHGDIKCWVCRRVCGAAAGSFLRERM
jgi:hypothetical protein